KARVALRHATIGYLRKKIRRGGNPSFRPDARSASYTRQKPFDLICPIGQALTAARKPHLFFLSLELYKMALNIWHTRENIWKPSDPCAPAPRPMSERARTAQRASARRLRVPLSLPASLSWNGSTTKPCGAQTRLQSVPASRPCWPDRQQWRPHHHCGEPC